jgi:hypothetical protein
MGRWGVGSLLGAALLMLAGAAIAEEKGHSDKIRPAKPGLAQATSAPSPAAHNDGSAGRQGAVLFEEDPDNPKGRSVPGFVIWRTEPADAATKTDVALRADLEIPERQMKLTMIFRRNTDPALPASHTVQISFTQPPDLAGGGIERIPGMLVKSIETARGTPLASATAKISDGAFLIGLSNVDADRTRNLQLLRERVWIDIPIVYASGRRAILAIEQASLRHKPLETAFGFFEQTSLAHAK